MVAATTFVVTWCGVGVTAGRVANTAAAAGGASEGVTQTQTTSSSKSRLSTMEDMERAHIEEVLRHANGMIAGKGAPPKSSACLAPLSAAA